MRSLTSLLLCTGALTLSACSKDQPNKPVTPIETRLIESEPVPNNGIGSFYFKRSSTYEVSVNTQVSEEFLRGYLSRSNLKIEESSLPSSFDQTNPDYTGVIPPETFFRAVKEIYVAQEGF